MVWLLGTCFWLILVSAYSTFGLAAGWAGRTAGHWFPRVVAVQLLCAVWLLVPDYRLWLLFLTQTCTVMLTLWCVRRRDVPRDALRLADKPRLMEGRARFSLADLFLAVLIVSIVFAILMRAPSEVRSEWQEAIVPGAVLGLVTLLAVWVVASPARLWIRLLTVIVGFPAWLMAGWLWLRRRANTRLRRTVARISLVAIVSPTAAFYGWMVWPHFLSPPAAPADNAYDDLVSTAEPLLRDPTDIRTLSGEALDQYLARDKSLLRRARAALARPCSVPWPKDAQNFDAVNSLRQLARLFLAEGRWHAAHDRLSEAMQSDLDAIRLGQTMTVGGLLLDHDVGCACEWAGLEALRQLAGRLNERDCEQLIAGLTTVLAAERESFDEVIQGERLHSDMTRSWQERFVMLGFDSMWNQRRTAFVDRRNRTVCSARLLQTHAALRRYRLNVGNYPATLAPLVPQYLEAAPVDPYSGRSMIYRLSDDGYQLYSVGPDGKDDEDAPITGAGPASTGDWSFDVAVDSSDVP
jgi:hypothetical protein